MDDLLNCHVVGWWNFYSNQFEGKFFSLIKWHINSHVTLLDDLICHVI